MSPDPIDDVREATIDELLSGKKALVRTAYFIVDSDLADEWAEARARVDELRYSNDEAALRSARAVVDDLRARVKEHTRAIRFKALGRDAYEKLVDQFPPSDRQRRDARDRGLGEPSWDLDKFPPRLLAAAAIAPQMSVDQAEALWNSEDYNQGELQLILTTALGANGGSRVLSLGKEFERTDA